MTDGASNFGRQKASQKEPNSFRLAALSVEYLACNFNSLHNEIPSFLIKLNNWPNVICSDGIGLLPMSSLSLLNILWENKDGNPEINFSFQ